MGEAGTSNLSEDKIGKIKSVPFGVAACDARDGLHSFWYTWHFLRVVRTILQSADENPLV